MCGFCVVFLSRSRRLVSFLSLGVVCCCFHVRIFWPSMGGDGFQTQRKSWVPGHIRAEQVLADAITIDAREEWICKFCSESNVWTWWRCRRSYSNIPAGLQEKHKQAIFAKNKGWSSGSSSSSGGEQKTPRDQEEEIKKLRAQVEILRKQQRMEKGRRRRESRREEEVVLKKTARSRLRKKLTARKSWVNSGKVCRNIFGTLRSLRTWSRCSRTARKKSGRVSCKRLKGRGQNFCRSTRRCRRGLRSCRVCRTRRENFSKRLVLVTKKCGKSVTKWRKEGCVLRACEKNRATVGWQQMIWKTKSRSCRQERKEEAAVRRRPTDVALIQPWWSRSSHVEQYMLSITSKPCGENSPKGPRLQPLRSNWREKRGKNGKETGMMRTRQVGVTEALRLVLLWILLGIKMQMVEAAEEEISTRQETDWMLETAPFHRAGNEIRWK